MIRTNIISTSGGLGSAITALAAFERGYPFELVFADTLIEDEDLYRFLNDIERVTGKTIHRLRSGLDPWDMFIERKYIGNTRLAHCSDELKTSEVMAWADMNTTPDSPIVLGMDWSELDRIERAAARWAPRPVISMINDFQVMRPTWRHLLAKYGIKIPRLYDMGFPHNNCGGFCVKAGLAQFATLLTRMPERFRWHELRQLDAMAKIGPTARPFLRRTVRGVVEYLTLRRFRELYEAGEIDIDPYDFGACGCFTEN